MFVTLRKPRLEVILEEARKMGDHKRNKGFIEEWFTYLGVSVFCMRARLPPNPMKGQANEV